MSSGGSEQRGFVFSVAFIIIFSTLLATVPAGLHGPDGTGSNVFPVNPNTLTAFSDGENYTKSAFSGSPLLYEYSLASKEWRCNYYATVFILAAKVLIAGILWLGHTDSVNFVSDTGADRGATLSLAEINEDSNDGTAEYVITHVISGEAAGGFIAYWNTTTYDNSSHAWDNDELYLLHGIGLESTATADIGALIISLLLLQLPDVPVLINLFIVVPIWACIIFVIWFIVKEMIPFL